MKLEVNTIYAWIDPQGSMIFSDNVLFPERTRLPFGAEEMISEQWNALGLRWDDRTIKTYNMELSGFVERCSPEDFSDAGLHLSVAGERLLIGQINPVLQSMACQPKSQNHQRNTP